MATATADMPSAPAALHSSRAAMTQLRPKSETSETQGLVFRDITLADLPEIERLLQLTPSRTCDYTIGGIYMWIDYFHYQYCIYRQTLFIKGVSEEDTSRPAFSLPIGLMPLSESIGLIEDYCRRNRLTMRFSAIPADRLDEFSACGDWAVEQLTDWSDYLYDIHKLASLSGNKLSKKRNHVNRFIADNPGYQLVDITADDAHRLAEAYLSWTPSADSDTYEQESRMTLSVLGHYGSYPFEGAYLTDGSGRIVAFTMGEIIGDTIYLHIEKMDHSVAGAGEAINKLFAERMVSRHPELVYANREEDCGDERLRYAKESYHPEMLLHKFDLTATPKP